MTRVRTQPRTGFFSIDREPESDEPLVRLKQQARLLGAGIAAQTKEPTAVEYREWLKKIKAAAARLADLLDASNPQTHSYIDQGALLGGLRPPRIREQLHALDVSVTEILRDLAPRGRGGHQRPRTDLAAIRTLAKLFEREGLGRARRGECSAFVKFIDEARGELGLRPEADVESLVRQALKPRRNNSSE